MLKKRIIPVLLLKNGRMVKGTNFSKYRDTGNPKTAVRIYSAQDADELVFIDIERNKETKNELLKTIEIAASECFMPLTAGGGVSNLEDVRNLINAGADKVLINTAAYENTKFVKDVVMEFGSQCVVIGIDYKLQNKDLVVFTNCGTKNTNLSLFEYVMSVQNLGIGEIFLNSIDLDGTMKGYDIKTVKKISKKILLPLIVSGGAGNFSHLADVFKLTDASAAACGSLFHFGDNNPIRARSYLKNQKIPMRKLK